MARIPYVPVPQVSQAKLGANTGRQNIAGVSAGAFGALSNPQVTSYTGTALQGVGRQLADVFEPWAREEMRLQQYKDNANTMDLGLAFRTQFEEAQAKLTGDGSGFAKSFIESIGKQAEDVRKSTGNQVPRDFDLKIKGLQAEYLVKALEVEQKTRNKFYAADIDRSNGVTLASISATPDQAVRDRLVGEMLTRIDKSGLDPSIKEVYKRKVQEDADLAYAYGLKDQNPDKVVADLGGKTSFAKRVAADESGDKPIGAHAGSSAWGRYGFTEGTWVSVANSPEGKAAGLDPSPEGRKSDAQQEIGMNILTKKNKQALEAQSIEPTEKNLKLAHFMGAGGATKMIREMVKDGDRPAAELFPAEAKANPKVFYYEDGSPRSLSAVYDRQTRGYGGNKPEVGSGDPVLARLPVTERMRVLQGAENEISNRERQEAAQYKAQQGEFLNDFALRLRSGEYGQGHINAAVESGQVTDIDDIRKLEGVLKEYTAKVTDFQLGMGRLQSGEQFNRFLPDDVKQVNAIAEQTLAATPPAQHDDQLTYLWDKTKVVPEQLSARIRNGAVSQNPQVIQRYGELAVKMLTDPNAFQGAKGEAELEEFGNRWQGMITAGYTPQEAAAKIAQMNEGSKPPQIKQVDELKKKLIDSPPTQDIINGLGFNGWFETSAQAKSPAVQGAMNADYTRLFLDEYMVSGDEKAAQGYALSKMKNTWGVFEGQMMKYPPDKAGYKPVGQENPYKWVQDSAAVDARAYAGKDVSKVELISDGQTIRERAAGVKPTYRLRYWTEVDGVSVVNDTPGLRWGDPKNTAYKGAEEKFQAEMTVRGAGLKLPGEVSQRRNETPQMAADRANREILRKQAQDAANAGPPLAERDRLDAEALAVPKGAPAPARYVRGMRVPGGQ